MAAMDFPANPTDGQIYGNYVYSTSTGAWLARSVSQQVAVTSPTAPSNPVNGTLWYNTNDGSTYIYYYDGDSSQWVQAKSDATLSSTLGSRVDALDYGANVNYLINADFAINQRGFTSSTTNYQWPADRWWNWLTDGTVTFSRQTFTPGAAPVPGYEAETYVRCVTSGQSAVTAQARLNQRIEDVRTLAGKSVTVSFWARSGSGNPNIAVEFVQNFGSGGSSNVAPAAGGLVTLTGGTAWTRYYKTFTIPSISGKTVGTASYLEIDFWFSAGSNSATEAQSIGIQNNTFDIWGVQLQEGVTATAFHRSMPTLQGELAACQRYFQTFGGAGSAKIGQGNMFNGTQGTVAVKFMQTMRAAPTFSYIGSLNDFRLHVPGIYISNVTAASMDNSSTIFATLAITAGSGGTAGQAVMFQSETSTAYVWFSAEL